MDSKYGYAIGYKNNKNKESVAEKKENPQDIRNKKRVGGEIDRGNYHNKTLLITKSPTETITNEKLHFYFQ